MNTLNGEALSLRRSEARRAKPKRRFFERTPRLSYEPLSQKDLEEVIAIANSVFPGDVHAEANPEFDYRASLEPEKYKDDLDRIGIDSLQHWTVKEKNKIVGLTGLYRVTADPADIIWLDWFCTTPEARGKGIGRKMLEWTVAQAKRGGCRKLCLWTTNEPNEAAAQDLYKSMGFKITLEEEGADGHKTFRREKVLSHR